MKPAAEQALRGIRESLVTAIIPSITDGYAQTQVFAMATQLKGIAGQLDGAWKRAREANAAVEDLLRRGAGALDGVAARVGRADWAATAGEALRVAASDPGDAETLSGLDRRFQRLNRCLAVLLEAFEEGAREGDEQLLAARIAVYTHLHEYHSAE